MTVTNKSTQTIIVTCTLYNEGESSQNMTLLNSLTNES